MLCNAGVWTLQTSFFFASRLEFLPPIGAPERDWKAGRGERRLSAPVSGAPSAADHLYQQQTVPAFSIFRHSSLIGSFWRSWHQLGAPPHPKSEPWFLMASHSSSFGLLCSESTLLPCVYPSPRTERLVYPCYRYTLFLLT